MMRLFLASALLAAAPLAVPALAAPQHLKVIGQQCASSLGLPAAVCNCIVQKAGAELNSNQQAFMAAQLSGNTAEVARIQGQLTPAEVTATGQFMSGVAGACGG
jgi:hypothetical protein